MTRRKDRPHPGRRRDHTPNVLERGCECGHIVNDHSPATGDCYLCDCKALEGWPKVKRRPR